jgi:hypothetical protein
MRLSPPDFTGFQNLPDRMLMFDLQFRSINALKLQLVQPPAAAISAHVNVLPAQRT